MASSGESASRAARLAGTLHLSLVPLGVFSFAYVPAVLIARNDIAGTVQNIAGNQALFRSGIISHLLSQVIVVFLMMAIHRLFSPIDAARTRLIVAMALVSVVISFVSELNQFAILSLLADASVDADGLQHQVRLLLELHRTSVLLAQIFWGLWLMITAFVILSSRMLPRWLGVLLLAASAGYLFDSAAYLAGARIGSIATLTFVGELTLPVWLLVKGVNGGENGYER